MKIILGKQFWLPATWMILSAAILWLDFFTGPQIAFPYFFFVPVVLAARYSGRFWGLFFALGLPLARIGYHFLWTDTSSFRDVLFNVAIRMALLVATALLVDRVTRQAREIQILRGCLPVCSICKKIRDSDQHWSAMETYITKHSEAEFSHTICPDCGERHYGEWLTKAPPVARK